MFCKNCGKDIADAKFCPVCGAAFESTATQPTIKVDVDKASIGMGILGFLIPIVGVIYYFVKKKDSPEKAKSALYGAIGGAVFWLFFYL